MERRDVLKFGVASLAAALQPAALQAAAATPSWDARDDSHAVEQWGLFELSLRGPSSGNPFKDVSLSAEFTHQHRTIQVTGFYDGDGAYRIRFMPDIQGSWTHVPFSKAKVINALIPRTTMGPSPPLTAFSLTMRTERPSFPSGPPPTLISSPAIPTPPTRC